MQPWDRKEIGGVEILAAPFEGEPACSDTRSGSAAMRSAVEATE